MRVASGAQMTVDRERYNESRLLDAAYLQFDIAAEKLGLSPGFRELMKSGQREFTVRFPVRMDDGSIRIFLGFRVQHSISRGPAKGGIRFHPAVELDG